MTDGESTSAATKGMVPPGWRAAEALYGRLQPLRLRFPRGLTVTNDVLMRLSAENPGLRLERTARGDLEIMSPSGSDSGSRNSLLIYRLGLWAHHEGNGLGVFFDSSAGFTLPNGAVRSPDAAWVALARWKGLSREQREDFSPLAPDFVAEVRSPSDRRPKLRAKMREYLAQGVRLGWLIDPGTLRVEVDRPGRPVETLERPATLSGEDVLPGFVLDLKGILFE